MRHLLVSPQFHRIHHSIEPRHQDKNFGVFLTVWDRWFGTLHIDYDEYPETGVAGVTFAPPTRLSPLAWARDLGKQILYPFRQILIGVRSAKPGIAPPRSDAAPLHASQPAREPARRTSLGAAEPSP